MSQQSEGRTEAPHIVKLFSWGGWMSGACHDFLMSDDSIKCIEHHESIAMRQQHRAAANTGETA